MWPHAVLPWRDWKKYENIKLRKQTLGPRVEAGTSVYETEAPTAMFVIITALEFV
jgi:hypothetical protein